MSARYACKSPSCGRRFVNLAAAQEHVATVHAHAGRVALTTARSTGRQVGLYDGRLAGMDTEGGRWQTVCEDHGWIISHDTLDLARSNSSVPEQWCEFCMNGTEPDC